MTREEDVFLRAIEVPRENRGAFVRAVCVGDEALRRSVQQLLEAHESGKSDLDRPHAASGTIKLILREMPSFYPAAGDDEGISR